MSARRVHIAIVSAVLLGGALISGVALGNGSDQGRERAAEAEAAAKAKAAQQKAPDLSPTEGMDASSLIMDMLLHGLAPLELKLREEDDRRATMRRNLLDTILRSRTPSPAASPPPAPAVPSEPLPVPVDYDDKVIM